MKFKTIIITKRTFIAGLGVLAALTAVMAAAAVNALNPKAVETFNDTELYEDILSQGLPNGERKGKSFKEILNMVLGFDVDKPESIIEEYSNIPGTVMAAKTPKPQATPSKIPAEEEKKEEIQDAPAQDNPAMPDKAMICSSVGLELNNATGYSVDVNAMCAEELAFKYEEDKPQVLIVHTHTTECYNGDQMSGETERNTDEALNVCAVGEVIREELEKYGIKTIHNKTIHDYPTYTTAYSSALKTIQAELDNNPSINVVLDIHRDAYVYSDGSKLTVTCEQNGVSTAKVMLVVGTNSRGLWHDNWRENLKFAAKIQNSAALMYPGLMRPINLRTERFNGHTSLGSLILEVGSNGNTLAQAKEGGRDAARAIAAVLLSNR